MDGENGEMGGENGERKNGWNDIVGTVLVWNNTVTVIDTVLDWNDRSNLNILFWNIYHTDERMRE